jgi:uncharacterized protein
MKHLLLLLALLVAIPSWAADRVVWFTIPVTSYQQAEKFYGNIFHWKFNPQQNDNAQFWFVMSGDEMVGELQLVDKPSHSSMMIYFDVKSIVDSLKQAEDLGATMLYPPMNVPSGGAITAFVDPFGNHIGLYQKESLKK